MLTGHYYWNLEAYQESQDLNAHYVQCNASKFVATDGNLIPTGELLTVDNTPIDFRKAKSVGLSISETTSNPEEFCGNGMLLFFSTIISVRICFKMTAHIGTTSRLLRHHKLLAFR